MRYHVANAGNLVRCPDCAARVLDGEAAGLVDGATEVPLRTWVGGRGEVVFSTVLVVDLRGRKLDDLPRALSLASCDGCRSGPGWRVELPVAYLATEPLFPEKERAARKVEAVPSTKPASDALSVLMAEAAARATVRG
jgi:hypothetical protein